MTKINRKTDAAESIAESPDEQAWGLREEMDTKLRQAGGICNLLCGADDDRVGEAASAAEDIVVATQKLLEELRDTHRARWASERGGCTPKEVQS